MTKRLAFYVLQIGVLDKDSPQCCEYQINQRSDFIMAPSYLTEFTPAGTTIIPKIGRAIHMELYCQK